MQASTQTKATTTGSAIRPMFTICLVYMGGIMVAKYYVISLTWFIFLLLMIVSICSIAVTRNKQIPVQQYFMFLIFAIAFMTAVIRTEIQIREWQSIQQTSQSLFHEQEHTIHGLIEDIRSSNTGTRITLGKILLNQDNHETHYPGKIELVLPVDHTKSFQVGQQIKTIVEVTPIWGTSVPTGMDWLAQRYANNIFGTVYVQQGHEINVTNDYTFQWRLLSHQAISLIKQSLPQHHWFSDSQDIQALISSIAFGIRSDMPEQLQAHLQRSGLAHITSISGLHVTFVLCFMFYLLKWVGLKRKQAAWATFLAGLIYLLMVGVRIPTLRAVMMAYVVFGQYLVQRRADSLNTLAIVAIIILLLNPMELFLPSFQLSFSAVLLLILYSPLFQAIEQSRLPKVFKWGFGGIAASAIVSAGLAPFTVYYFHYFSWGAILGNLFAVSLLFLFLPLVYLWVMLIQVPVLNEMLGYLVGLIGTGLTEVIHYFGRTQWFWFDVSTPAIWWAVIIFLSMLILSKPKLIWYSVNQFNIKSFHIVLFLVGIGFWLQPVVQAFSPLQVYFLALGQGDCTFIQTPSGKTILVDGGPKPTRIAYGRNPYLVDFLKHKGITNIDAMVLTHPQSDHIGAFIDVIESFNIYLFIEGVIDAETNHYQQLVNLLDQKQIERVQIKTGDCIQFDKNTIAWVLHPDDHAIQSDADVNEASIVLLLQYKKADFLLTGDIGASTEQQLTNRFDNWDVDVMKVPHHGSRYSSSEELLRETLPEFSIIQVGRNPYGHPHDDVKTRLSKIKSNILRTDYDGTVQIKIWDDTARIYSTKSNQLFIHTLD